MDIADIALLVDRLGCTHEAAESVLQALLERGWRRPILTTTTVQPPPSALSSTGLLQVYADGACSGNPGPGRWAVVMVRDGKVVAEHAGGLTRTTNNQMELTAVREALRHAPADAPLEVLTDSQNVIGWLSKGWKRNHVEVARLSAEIDGMAKARTGGWSFTYVKGHAGHEFNERADKLAVKARDAAR